MRTRTWQSHACGLIAVSLTNASGGGKPRKCLIGCAVLLTQASRQDMLEMVGTTVMRLQRAPMQRQHSGLAAPKLLQSPQQDAAARDAHAAPGALAAFQNGSSAAAHSADGEESETGALREDADTRQPIENWLDGSHAYACISTGRHVLS